MFSPKLVLDLAVEGKSGFDYRSALAFVLAGVANLLAEQARGREQRCMCVMGLRIYTTAKRRKEVMQMVTDMNAEKDGDKRTALLNGFFTTTEAADFCAALPF
jgi:hypothetical protein